MLWSALLLYAAVINKIFRFMDLLKADEAAGNRKAVAMAIARMRNLKL